MSDSNHSIYKINSKSLHGIPIDPEGCPSKTFVCLEGLKSSVDYYGKKWNEEIKKFEEMLNRCTDHRKTGIHENCTFNTEKLSFYNNELSHYAQIILGQQKKATEILEKCQSIVKIFDDLDNEGK